MRKEYESSVDINRRNTYKKQVEKYKKIVKL